MNSGLDRSVLSDFIRFSALQMNEILFSKKTLRSVCRFSGKMWAWLSFLSSHNIEVGENISPKLGNFSFDSINYFHEILDESEV